MRIIASIEGIGPDRVGDEVFRDLCRLHPEGEQGRRFACRLPQDDPVFRAVVDRLAHAGFRPWDDRFRKRQPDEYTLDLEREYLADDFRDGAYFEPIPQAYCEGLTRDDEGRIELNVDRLQPGVALALAHASWLVASPQIKAEIEGAGLRHAVFRPTSLADEIEGPIPWEGHGDPLWELTSDLLLPLLSPSCTLFHDDGQQFTGDYSRGCLLKEGLFRGAELRYKASDLAGVEAFDLARTHERFGLRGPGDEDRRLVASRRFYEFCTGHGVGMDWIPVRIEP